VRSNAPAAPILGWQFRGLPPAIPGWHRSTPSTDLFGKCTVSVRGVSSRKTGVSAQPRSVRRVSQVAVDYAAGASFLSAARRRRWHSIPSATWPDAQLQYGATARRVGQRPAPYAVAVLAATAVTGRTRSHPTPRLGAVEAPEGAVADPAAAQGRAGREQVRPWYTRLPRCER